MDVKFARVDAQSRKCWTHCNVDIKILTKLSVDKAEMDIISTHHACEFLGCLFSQSWDKTS